MLNMQVGNIWMFEKGSWDRVHGITPIWQYSIAPLPALLRWELARRHNLSLRRSWREKFNYFHKKHKRKFFTVNVAAVSVHIAICDWDGKKKFAVKKVKVKVSSFTHVRHIGRSVVIDPLIPNPFTRWKRVREFESHSNPPWPYSYSDAE